MSEEQAKSEVPSLPRWGLLLLDTPWLDMIGELWKIGRKIIRGLASEGVYEVLDYESTLELHDRKGKHATFTKRERVCYLQNYIIAYQDQAWGDGEILVDYRCTPGTPVDRYRSGYKTHVLISLREVKNKGDIDEFNIEWGIHRGFLLQTGFWATEISHRTRQAKVQIIFPKGRPPMRASIVEKNRQRTRILNKDSIIQLPDGRWMVSWQCSQPKLFEQYVINWEW